MLCLRMNLFHIIKQHFIFQETELTEISAFPSGDNLFHWTATILGVKDTVSLIVTIVLVYS